VISRLVQARVVPIVVIDDPGDALPLADALHAGGMDTVEVTLRTPAGIEAIRRICSQRSLMFVVAGTVLSATEAQACLDAGAGGLISPGFDPEMSSWCRDHGMDLVPGVATASEILAAANAGHRLLKFFPAKAAGGMPALTALYAPFAKLDLSFMPTGGLGLDDLPSVLAHDFVAAMGGTWIAPASEIAAGGWAGITARAAQAVSLAASSS
jgi:2-dehydro-3-deoxyphosphogluconate aldolase / (4S)-4-hydroxy-2-oxoglutarate aldolase